MDLPQRHPSGYARRLETTDPSPAPAPPLPTDPSSDPDGPNPMILGDEYTTDVLHRHVWDRGAAKYVPPRPEDLPCPPNSLVDPHGSVGAARTQASSTAQNAQLEPNRPHRLRSEAAVDMSRAVSAFSHGGVGQQSVPSDRLTVSATLSGRERERQIKHDATDLQAAATPEDKKAVIEELMSQETAPTPQAVRQYYRQIAAKDLAAERAQDEQAERERERDGMLFGSELAQEQNRKEGGNEGRGVAWGG